MKHPTKKWEITMMEIHNDRIYFKVTRRIPELEVSETKMFVTKEKAKKQFEEWLK